MKLRNVAATLAFASLAAQAHPGHEPFSEGVKHFATSPTHFVVPLLISALLFATAHFIKRQGARACVQITAVAIVLVTFLS